MFFFSVEFGFAFTCLIERWSSFWISYGIICICFRIYKLLKMIGVEISPSKFQFPICSNIYVSRMNMYNSLEERFVTFLEIYSYQV